MGPRAVTDPVHVRKHMLGNREVLCLPASEQSAYRAVFGKSEDARRR